MNLSELRTFLTIIETGSLVRASEALNVTQSTVTARLKALEDELGQRLMHRQKSGIVLTAAGNRLQRYASTISDLWQQARHETALPDGMQSICNLACHPDLWPDLGEKLFAHIRDTQPNVALSIWTGGQYDLASWLDQGLVDVALTYWPSTRATVLTEPLIQDRLIQVSTDPTRFDATQGGYVFVEAGDNFSRAHASAFPQTDAARLSFGAATLGRDYILRNGGAAYLPARIAHPDIGSELQEIAGAPQFTRQIYAVSRTTACAGWPWLGSALDTLRS